MIASSTAPKFDILKLFSQAFAYAKHIRLMVLMMAFGILLGIAAFLFMRPVFESTAMISVKTFGRAIGEPKGGAGAMRGLISSFDSPRIQLQAARRLGLLGAASSSKEVVEIVPKLRVNSLDGQNLEMQVFAYDPSVVRDFSKAMVEAYGEIQRESYEEFRNAAITRYREQLVRLEDEISKSIKSLTAVGREQNLTQVTLQQRSLLQIPKQLAETREQIERMKGVRALLEKLETQAEVTEVDSGVQASDGEMSNLISLLSLLDSFEDETHVSIGDVFAFEGSRLSPLKSPEDTITGKIVDPSNVGSIEPWKGLEKERRILLDNLDTSSKIYQPDHRFIREIKNKLATTEHALKVEFKILRQKFDLNYASLVEKEKLLESRMPEYHAITEQVGLSSQAYSSIAAQQEMWDQARQELSIKANTLDFLEEFDWVEVSYKGMINLRDEDPVSPNKMKIFIIALAIGVAGAFGAPTILNVLDTSTKTVGELEQAIGVSGIGIVPLTPKEMLEDVARSPAQGASVPNYLLECFRVIRANIIMHPNRHNKSQVVMVTSARPQEGKTTQASNLAWAFQSMGEKTLLIDCDLRRGRIHGVIGIDKSPGMTRLLLGEYTKEEVIQSAGPGGFDVIPRGPVIAGTTDLLCQAVFHDLIEQFRKDYDRIVIDAPPVLGLSESSSLQEVVDGTVLVVRAEKTGRKDVTDAVSLLRRCNAHFFGFVLNAVDLSKLGNYYNYYYYSAPYYDQVEPEEEPERRGVSKRVQRGVLDGSIKL